MKRPAPECRVVTRRRPDGLADVFLLDPVRGKEAMVFPNLRPHEVDAAVLRAKNQLLASGDRVSFAQA